MKSTDGLTYTEEGAVCEQVLLSDIAHAVGTPTYVYSQQILHARAAAYLAAAEPGSLLCYATKANANVAILRQLADIGLGADVTSGGELFLALEAGFSPQKIIYSGVGKTDEEIRMALNANIRALHIESPLELEIVAQIAAEMGKIAPVGVRLNPNIAAETHPYISTGLAKHKFGVPIPEGMQLIQMAHRSAALRPVGIAAHIGSQIRDIAPFGEAAQRLVDIAAELQSQGIHIDYVDVGGGLGINYEEALTTGDLDQIDHWVKRVAEPIRDAGLKLVAEPGRSIIGPAGFLLARVVFIKHQGNKRFIITDTGMNDLLRPTLYQAYHPIWPVLPHTTHAPLSSADIVGPICESSDFLAKDRPFPNVQRGDLIVVGMAGAYGFAMSSNYNGRRKPAEVLVNGDQWRLIRPRQTYDALLS